MATSCVGIACTSESRCDGYRSAREGGKAKKPTQKATAMRRPAFRVHPSDSFDELNSDSDNETTDAPPTIKKRKANASSVEDVPDSPPVKVVRQDDVVHVSNNSYV
jgi:hypothetical protein